MVDAVRHARGADLPAAAEDLAREVTLLGTYDQAADMISAWFAAGADRVQLVLPPGRHEAELAQMVDVAAEYSPVSAISPTTRAAGVGRW